jgi:uncharacterized protein
MTMMSIVCADDVPPQPWRNGAGRTRELLAWPSAADWALRISLADIDADAPFSTFAGVQRWFAVLDGGGVVLRFAAGERRLVPGSAPLCFDGAAAPGCRLIDGPTRDLNLMLRAGSATMELAPSGTAWTHAAPQRGLFCAAPGLWRCGDGRQQGLAARSLLWLVDAAALEFSFDADNAMAAYWLAFDPEGGAT